MSGPYWDQAFDKVRTLPEALSKPLRRRKPTTFFVCNTSDLYHPSVPFEFIAAVYGVMAACPQHTFLVLTKRPERRLEFMRWMAEHGAEARALMMSSRMPKYYPQAWYEAAKRGSVYVDGENAIGGAYAKPPAEYGPLHRRLKSRNGSDPSEWPEDLDVQELAWKVGAR